MIKVYVSCSLTCATLEFRQSVDDFKQQLREAGYHVLDFLGVGSDATPRRIYDWDVRECVGNSDLVVVIADQPSLGAGMEIQKQIDRGMPVLTVAHHDSLVSEMVMDPVDDNYEFKRYGDLLTEVLPMVHETARRIQQQN